MTNMNLLRGLALLMIVGSSLGLTACATCEGEACAAEEYNVAVFDDSQDIYADPLLEDCQSETEECFVGNENGDFLTEKFVETYTAEVPAEAEGSKLSSKTGKQKKTSETLIIKDDSSLALSRPSVTRGVSVKEKQASMVVQKPETLTVKSVKTVRTVKPVVVDSIVKEEIVVKEPVIKESVDTEKTEAVEEPKVEAPVVEEEATVVDVSVPQEKKITTTITETTTTQKIQPEVVIEESVVENTLQGRVSYGQQIHDWEALPGDTLRMLLSEWGEKSGWTVVWKLDRDYHLEAGVVFRGNFVDVASAIIRSFARATPAPIGTFYKGNRVLVVSTQEDENER